MSGDVLDLGHGHILRWLAWSPDRELNPQYAELPDVEKFAAIIRHPLLDTDDRPFCRQQGYCEGVITLGGHVADQVMPARSTWNVGSWDPLTLSPSLLCHCGDHGFIIDGHWRPA